MHPAEVGNRHRSDPIYAYPSVVRRAALFVISELFRRKGCLLIYNLVKISVPENSFSITGTISWFVTLIDTFFFTSIRELSNKSVGV